MIYTPCCMYRVTLQTINQKQLVSLCVVNKEFRLRLTYVSIIWFVVYSQLLLKFHFFRLYPAWSGIGRGSLVLRDSASHFLPFFFEALPVEWWNSTLSFYLLTRIENINNSLSRIELESTIVALCFCPCATTGLWPMYMYMVYIGHIFIFNFYSICLY